MTFWPAPYGCAISITFDDGMRSQKELAVPALDERGFCATFYVNPTGDDTDTPQGWRERLAAWKTIQAKGHEIGNHTLSHPCGLNIRAAWLKDRHLHDWSLEQIDADIRTAQERITQAFPAQKYTSFAYPCYESDIGRGAGRTSYTPVVARRCIAGRAGGEPRGELANDPQTCDLFHLSSWASERRDGALLIGLVELALAYGRWGVFTFHGINEGHLPVGESDFTELLDHLARRRDAVWVAPLAEVAAYAAAHRQG